VEVERGGRGGGGPHYVGSIQKQSKTVKTVIFCPDFESIFFGEFSPMEFLSVFGAIFDCFDCF
jgi:hypothetical protein